MTQTQQYSPPAPPTEVRRWRVPAAGEVVARDLPLWLTRHGDADDHVLQPGERVVLRRGDDVVIEALRRAHPPVWDWVPVARHEPAGRIPEPAGRRGPRDAPHAAGQPSPRLPGLRRLAAWLARLRAPARASAARVGRAGAWRAG
jgi:hypothetical protein